MIKIPFTQATFSADIKTCISGVNVQFDYYNIVSSITKVAADMISVLGEATYNRIIELSVAPDPTKAGSEEAVDALKRAMLHFAFYEHEIFITVRIGNDGITVKKNDDETTAFKYQTDALSEKLVGLAWFWLGLLFGILNKNPDTFPEWKDSDQAKDISDLPITSDDFGRWFGVTDTYFIIKVRALIRQVYKDEIEPRMKKDANIAKDSDPAEIKSLRAEVDSSMRRAAVFKIMALSIRRFDYFELPEPVRRDYNNEMGKNHAAQADSYVKTNLANAVDADGDKYLRMLEENVQLLNQALNPPVERPIAKEADRRSSDKFVFMG